jgi:hypothetical protein
MPDNSALFNALAAGLALDAVECAESVQRLSGDRSRSRLRWGGSAPFRFQTLLRELPVTMIVPSRAIALVYALLENNGRESTSSV